MKTTKLIGAIITNDNNELFTLYHNKIANQTIPMGKIEDDETSHAATIRELREELGIHVIQLTHFLGFSILVKSYRDGKPTNLYMDLMYINKYKGKITNKEPNKHANFEYYSFTQLYQMSNKSEIDSILKNILNRLNLEKLIKQRIYKVK